MAEEEDPKLVDDRPMHVLQFEGEYVREMEGRFPAQSVEMPAGYARGMHLLFNVEARVRNVHYDEDRKGDLTRVHRFAIEHVHLAEAFDPNDRPDNVGGSAAGDAWRERLLDYLEGRSEELDLEGEDVPDRLAQLLSHGHSPMNLSIAAPEPVLAIAGPEIDGEAGF